MQVYKILTNGAKCSWKEDISQRAFLHGASQEAVWDDSLDRVGYSAKPTMVSLAGHDNRGTKATYDIIECYILNICIDRGYSDNA